MKVLIIGGMHGNETLGLKLVNLLTEKPLQNVDAIIANEKATAANCRFTGKDMNRSFPGKSESNVYEDSRAAELLLITKKYDVVLDFHNTHCPDNDCGFIGEGAPKSLSDVSWLLGLDRVIVADYDCINKYATNCLSVEISLDSDLNNPTVWYERILMLARLNRVDVRAKVRTFKFVYRMTIEDRDKYGLQKKNLQAFKQLDQTLATSLGLASPAYPIFIGDAFTPYNYGGVLEEFK